MTFNVSKIVGWGTKLWLFFFPWQTMLIIRQTQRGDSYWASNGIAVPLMALWLLALTLVLVFLHRKELLTVLKEKTVLFSSLFIFLFLVIWHSKDSLIALQSIFFWFLGMSVVWVSSKKIISKKEWVFWLCLGSIGPSLLGLYQFFSQSNFSSTILGLSALPSFAPGAPVIVGEWGRWLRASGSFPHPNIFAGYLVIIIAAIFSLIRNCEITPKIHWFYRILLIFLTAALIATVSRTGLIAWGILVVIEHYYDARKYSLPANRVLLFITVLTLVIGIGMTWPLFSGRIGLSHVMSAQESGAISERITGLHSALLIGKENWLLGTGPGNYTVALAEFYPNFKGYELQPVHNVPILFMAEWGILGIILVGLGAWYFLKNSLNKPEILLALLPLLPLIFFDHYLYDIWAGIMMLGIYISSTVYPHHGSTQPKK